ncbi:hypothetical protein [Desulfovibrio ferrophilus]|uniref:Uncharacterized protein n=1 Tax=Desulfovibrio ferrophilus TaxID=241368 RepID=A0A2Z6B1Q1_9BACT|nr:hypothetical protein [Desulfovibrio ferrophilus]BBD09449.1 uncharacterized protein DFE_2723 [Desulfovibrio ferrophilus]
MIQPIQSGYAPQSIGTDYAVQNRQSPQQAIQHGDSVNLSDSAHLISSFFADLGVEYTPGEGVSLDALEAGLNKSQDKLKSDIGALFIQYGISTTPPVELTSDGEGKIRVKGDHPQKDQIEQLFANRPELANDFRKVSGLSSLVEAGKEYLEFAEAYAKDAYAAVAQYSHLFNNMESESFSMIFGEDEEQAEV